jgi:hypothetical protein
VYCYGAVTNASGGSEVLLKLMVPVNLCSDRVLCSGVDQCNVGKTPNQLINNRERHEYNENGDEIGDDGDACFKRLIHTADEK